MTWDMDTYLVFDTADDKIFWRKADVDLRERAGDMFSLYLRRPVIEPELAQCSFGRFWREFEVVSPEYARAHHAELLTLMTPTGWTLPGAGSGDRVREIWRLKTPRLVNVQQSSARSIESDNIALDVFRFLLYNYPMTSNTLPEVTEFRTIADSLDYSRFEFCTAGSGLAAVLNELDSQGEDIMALVVASWGGQFVAGEEVEALRFLLRKWITRDGVAGLDDHWFGFVEKLAARGHCPRKAQKFLEKALRGIDSRCAAPRPDAVLDASAAELRVRTTEFQSVLHQIAGTKLLDAQQKFCDEVLSHARAKRGGLMVLDAQAGSGKTTTLRSIVLRLMAERRHTVCFGVSAQASLALSGSESTIWTSTLHRGINLGVSSCGGAAPYQPSEYQLGSLRDAACIIVDEVFLAHASWMQALHEVGRMCGGTIIPGDEVTLGDGLILSDQRTSIMFSPNAGETVRDSLRVGCCNNPPPPLQRLRHPFRGFRCRSRRGAVVLPLQFKKTGIIDHAPHECPT